MKKTSFFKVTGIVAGIIIPMTMVFAGGNNGFVSTPPIVAGNIIDYNQSPVQRLFSFIQNVLYALPPILVACAGAVFMFYIVKFIWSGHSGDEQAREAARHHVMWSLLALVVLLGFWGIVTVLLNMLGLRAGGTITSAGIPRVQIQ